MSMVAAALLAATPAPEGPACRVLTVAKAAGERVDAADTVAAPCAAGERRPTAGAVLRFDRRTGTVRAATDLGKGTALGLAWLPARPAVQPGDHVRVAVRAGHVVVARDVVALQPALSGQRFFVKGDDGTIFVASAAVGDTRP